MGYVVFLFACFVFVVLLFACSKILLHYDRLTIAFDHLNIVDHNPTIIIVINIVVNIIVVRIIVCALWVESIFLYLPAAHYTVVHVVHVYIQVHTAIILIIDNTIAVLLVLMHILTQYNIPPISLFLNNRIIMAIIANTPIILSIPIHIPIPIPIYIMHIPIYIMHIMHIMQYLR